MDPSLFRTETEFHVGYDAAVPCVAMRWRGYHTSGSFRAHNEQVLAMLAGHRASRLLCDIRHFLLIGAVDQEWLVEVWLPRAVAAGLRRCAIVTPLFHFNRVAVHSVIERVDGLALRIAHFEGTVQARDWLRESERMTECLSSSG